MVEFRWNDWNIEHVAKHGVEPDEAELVVIQARAPYPVARSDDKYLVWGPGRADRRPAPAPSQAAAMVRRGAEKSLPARGAHCRMEWRSRSCAAATS